MGYGHVGEFEAEAPELAEIAARLWPGIVACIASGAARRSVVFRREFSRVGTA
jgi:hypothetical protein